MAPVGRKNDAGDRDAGDVAQRPRDGTKCICWGFGSMGIRCTNDRHGFLFSRHGTLCCVGKIPNAPKMGVSQFHPADLTSCTANLFGLANLVRLGKRVIIQLKCLVELDVAAVCV